MFWKAISLISLICIIALGILLYNENNPRNANSTKNIVKYLVETIDTLRANISERESDISLLQYYIEKLELEFEMSREKGRYLVINRHASQFCVREGDAMIYEGTCGVGVGKRKLTGRIYDFETPAGLFAVQRKIVDPWWYRPDWFWKEKGISVPKNMIQYPKGISYNAAVAFYNSLSEEDKLRVRAVPGYLGKYALQISDGIYIHYGRQRTGAVSHGCIRVSEKDAETLYHLLDLDAPVYVY